MLLAALLLTAPVGQAQTVEKTQAQIQFEKGLQFFLDSDYAAAADTFRQLYAATGSERVRLEWARASYLQQDFAQAETLFKAVLSANPPLPVREKIRFFLDDMSLAQGRLDYSVSLERDSNPRLIPNVRSFNIFGLPFEYAPPTDTRPKWGVNYRLSGSKGLDDNNRWIASAGLLGVHYGQPLLNKKGWDSHLTYRLSIEPRAEIKLSHESMDMGGKALYRYTWATLLHVRDTPSGWRWSNELRHGKINYPLYDYQNSHLSGYRLATEKSVSDAFLLGAELGWDHGNAAERAYAYTALSHGLSGTYLATSLETRMQLKWLSTSRKNAEMDPFFGVLREDKRSSLKLLLEPVNFSVAGMTPVVELGYEKNRSTLALINYTRAIASITFRRSY